ncbi:hypothetical protein AHF37_11349 [Paragonimus kellicotti]|nr:hypothetical protein AHF37_11349 [Paragonimus kellicotti]
MLNSKGYTKSIDIWSVGCIFGEMFNSRPLFPGKHYVDQLSLILGVLGYPNREDQTWIVNSNARRFVEKFKNSPRKPWKDIYPMADPKDPKVVGLLGRLLAFNSTTGITVVEALAHPYLECYYDPNDEVCCLPIYHATHNQFYKPKTSTLVVILTIPRQECIN